MTNEEKLYEALEEIKGICSNAKDHYIEESDIDEILEVIKKAKQC